jgi:hypothetical protein
VEVVVVVARSAWLNAVQRISADHFRRPGSEEFVVDLEKRLGRELWPRRPGPKPEGS